MSNDNLISHRGYHGARIIHFADLKQLACGLEKENALFAFGVFKGNVILIDRFLRRTGVIGDLGGKKLKTLIVLAEADGGDELGLLQCDLALGLVCACAVMFNEGELTRLCHVLQGDLHVSPREKDDDPQRERNESKKRRDDRGRAVADNKKERGGVENI